MYAAGARGVFAPRACGIFLFRLLHGRMFLPPFTALIPLNMTGGDNNYTPFVNPHIKCRY